MSHVVQQIRKAVLFLILSFIGVGALAFIVISDVANFFVKEQAQQVAVIVGTFAKTCPFCLRQRGGRKAAKRWSWLIG